MFSGSWAWALLRWPLGICEDSHAKKPGGFGWIELRPHSPFVLRAGGTQLRSRKWYLVALSDWCSRVAFALSTKNLALCGSQSANLVSHSAVRNFPMQQQQRKNVRYCSRKWLYINKNSATYTYRSDATTLKNVERIVWTSRIVCNYFRT